ncbi:MAG: D-alanyl-D-alanine carboxypeptidase [Cyanobacteria bacterium P01_F01_bin.86]
MLHKALLAFGFLSLISNQPEAVATFQPIEWPSMDAVISWQSPWVLKMNTPDPKAAAIVRSYLTRLTDQGFPTNEQGIWIQTGATAIATHQGDQALSAASLTKIATTLAALNTWKVSHRFETLIGHTGVIENGTIQGDLVIHWDGDPYFVWEEAIAIANTLQQQGIQQISGNLVILGDFAMNFQSDPTLSGEIFRQAVDFNLWPAEVWRLYDLMPSGTAQPSLLINGEVILKPVTATAEVSRWLVRHQSLPLVALLKAMNIYSNNEMAEQLAVAAGGTNTVVAKVVEKTRIPVTEIRLINGSGLGNENQISPRAAVAMLLAIQRQLRPYGLSVADVMPVFGQDEGTLIFRELPNQSALKTGTLATVSSLAGVFPTSDRGPVWFSIQNRGGNIELLRAQQDALLLALEQHWGNALPPDYLQPKIIMGKAPYQLGDPERNLPF